METKFLIGIAGDLERGELKWLHWRRAWIELNRIKLNNEWMNDCMNERRKEGMNKGMTECTWRHDWMYVYMHEQMNEWMDDCGNERMTDWINDWMSN